MQRCDLQSPAQSGEVFRSYSPATLERNLQAAIQEKTGEIAGIKAQLSEAEEGARAAQQALLKESSQGEAMQAQICQLTEAVARLC